MYDGWGYRLGDVWLPPLKRFAVDGDGHLRLAYWQQNEALKGKRLNVDVTRFREYPGPGQSPAGSVDVEVSGSRLGVTVGPEHRWIDPHRPPLAVFLLPEELPGEGGIVLEAKVSITCESKLGTTSAVGLFLEEAPHASGRRSSGNRAASPGSGQLTLDGVGRGVHRGGHRRIPVALLPMLQLDRTHLLRLLLRRNMFEVYLDDLYVQTFNTSRIPGSTGAVPRRVGFVVQNGQAVIEEVAAWQMTLD